MTNIVRNRYLHTKMLFVKSATVVNNAVYLAPFLFTHAVIVYDGSDEQNLSVFKSFKNDVMKHRMYSYLSKELVLIWLISI